MLYLGDCLDILPSIQTNSVDLVLTDPPYGTTNCDWDVVPNLPRLWTELKRIGKENCAYLFHCMQPFTTDLIMSNRECFKYHWIWIKERPTNVLQIKKRPGKNFEEICVFYRKPPIYNPQKTIHTGKLRTNKVKNGSLGQLIDQQNKKAHSYRDDRTRYPLATINFQRDILKSNLHPTQKPLALIEYLIKTYTNEDALVLDCFAGSGTTGVACQNLNRSCILIEKNSDYFEMIKARLLG